jgi:hypothetical protein
MLPDSSSKIKMIIDPPGPWKHRKPGEHDQSRRRNKRRKLPPVRARQKGSDHDGVLWEQR